MSNDLTAHFTEIISIIEKAKAKIYKAVNNGLIDMYWEVGEYISRKVAENGWGEKVQYRNFHAICNCIIRT